MNAHNHESAFGVGAYTLPEASRLLGLKHANVRRWLKGYKYQSLVTNTKSIQAPLWSLQHRLTDDQLYLGFKDLIELKIVSSFLSAGVSLQTVRYCLIEARKIIADTHPFATLRFKTDGKSIFLEHADESGLEKTIDLKKRQFILDRVFEQSFRDLDISGNVVSSWRPYKGKDSIIIDPKKSFGQPVLSAYGVPTSTLALAVESEGSIRAAARAFEVPVELVRDAVNFERGLVLH